MLARGVEACDRRAGFGARPACAEPSLASDRGRGASRVSRAGALQAGSLGQERPALHLLQVPHDGRRKRPERPSLLRGATHHAAVRGTQRRYRFIQARARSPGDKGGQAPEAHEPRRAASVAERRSTARCRLVGPRPPLVYEVELYSERAFRRLECTPGITGLWQVSGRCLTTFDEMVELDIEYIENWSLGLDMAILARTLPAVINGGGAF